MQKFCARRSGEGTNLQRFWTRRSGEGADLHNVWARCSGERRMRLLEWAELLGLVSVRRYTRGRSCPTRRVLRSRDVRPVRNPSDVRRERPRPRAAHPVHGRRAARRGMPHSSRAIAGPGAVSHHLRDARRRAHGHRRLCLPGDVYADQKTARTTSTPFRSSTGRRTASYTSCGRTHTASTRRSSWASTRSAACSSRPIPCCTAPRSSSSGSSSRKRA